MMNNKKNLSLHEKFLRDLKIKKIKTHIIQFSILAVFLLIWQMAASLQWIDDFITSSPIRIVKTIALMKPSEIFKHIGVTLTECIIGFIVSTLLGILIAIVLWWFEFLRKVLEPYIVILNALPKIALGPLIIIWVGAGYKAIIFMTVLISIIVTVMSVLSGFLSCDDGKLLLMRSMGASKLLVLTKLILPHSVPNFMSVLKINVGLSWVGVIMGEYLVSSAGLGYLIIYGGQVFKLDLVMASTVILCCLAGLMYVCISSVEKLVTRLR